LFFFVAHDRCHPRVGVEKVITNKLLIGPRSSIPKEREDAPG
jgi:hypothetical protein